MTNEEIELFDYGKFIENMRELTEMRGMTMKDLSLATHVTEATLSRYMNLIRHPDIINVMKFANYFGVSIEYLLGIEEKAVRDLPEEFQHLIKLFAKASDADKNVIMTLLSRYES